MKRLLPLAFALAVVAWFFPRVDAQRPVFTTGTPAELAQAQTLGLARLRAAALEKGIDGASDLVVTGAHVDRQAMAHTRVQQRFRGIPVLGGEAIAHFNQDGSAFAETDNLIAGITVDPAPRLTPAAAIDIAVTDYGCRTCLTAEPVADLWIVRDESGVDHLAYRVRIKRLDGTDRTALPVRYVDAHSGSIVLAYDNLQTGTGSSLYSGTVDIGTSFNTGAQVYVMENLTRRLGTFDLRNTQGPTIFRFLDGDDFWDSSTQRAGVDAHYGGERYLEYLNSVHGRNGIDGAGGPLVVNAHDGSGELISAIVHFGVNYNNAFWDGDSNVMVYGDGDGSLFGPLVTIDIAGHEMTHGVTQFTANLIYHGESGALNESWSDVFGAMLERYVRGETADTWLIGEQALTPFIAGDALRFMDDPHRAQNFGFTADDDPDHYSERCTVTCPDTPQGDNGGVHINSGIPNKAFYLLAKGGIHHLGGSMTGIGADAASRIWFTALTSYMTSGTNFAGARDATSLAAAALYGNGSTEHQAVARAWCLVGVGTCLAVNAISVSPNAGSGMAQSFTLEYSNSTGASDLSARVRFGTSSSVAAGTCSVWYDASAATIKLMNDAGVWGAPVSLGSGTLSNSQCTLNLDSSTATPNGNNLTLVLNITFTTSFTGQKNIYMLAGSLSVPASNTGWIQRGTWSVLGLAAVSVSPNSGSGSSQLFTLHYTDSLGASDLTSARVRFGASNVGPGTCTVWYDAAAGTIRLMNDAGVWGSPVPLGSAALSNSQCTLHLASSAAQNGNDLTLSLSISFSASFAGQKQIYMLAGGAGGANTGWQQRGTWTVPSPGPAAISVLPNSGSGLTQAFTLLYTHTNGAANLTSARVRFGASNVGPSTCTAKYNAMAGTIELLNDAGTNWMTGTLGSGTLANSQCTLILASSSATVNGADLLLVLNVTFSVSFSGAKNIYMLAADDSMNTGWQQKGTWTVPAPTVSAVSVSPNVGAGLTQAFTLQYSDSFGAADLTSVRVRVAASNVGPGTCTASYSALTGAVALLNDIGTAWTMGALGSGTLSNSQCTLNLTNSSAASNGTNLTLVLSITFAQGFAGQKNIYMLAQSSSGMNTGWQQRGTWSVPGPSGPTTALLFDSQPGDYIGGGVDRTYTPADGTFSISRNYNNGISVSVIGPSYSFWWYLDFAAADDAPLQVGSYGNATRMPFTSFNGLDVSGSGRGCNELTGRFRVLEVVYDPSGNVQRFAVDFEQHCEDADPALFGALRFNSTVASLLPFGGNYPSYRMRIAPPLSGKIAGAGIDCGSGGQACEVTLASPANLTLTATPDAGYLFAGWTGNCHGAQTIVVRVNTEEECSAVFDLVNSGAPRTLLYWNSQQGNYVGQGEREVYSPTNSRWSFTNSTGSSLELNVRSVDDRRESYWYLNFRAPTGQVLAPGAYNNVGSFPTATTAGMYVSGNGRGCTAIQSSFVVHEILFVGATLSRLALDFEMQCDSITIPARPLIGSIRYNSTVLPTASLALTFTGHGTVTLSPSGQVCTFNCTETPVVNTSIQLTAVPDAGWSFVGWSGDADCTDGNVTLTAPTACRATFQQISISGTPEEPELTSWRYALPYVAVLKN